MFAMLCRFALVLPLGSFGGKVDAAMDIKVPAVASTVHESPQKLAEGCTSILVAKGAAAGGATMTSHTNDCYECDFRLSRVPAKRHAAGAVRPLYPGREAYPRYIGTDRGETYKHVDTSIYPWKAGEGDFAVMATTPEVRETFAYLDGSYGILNEHGLAMGESTCGSLLTTRSLAKGGKAKFDIRELGRIALERCMTASCAVDTMGSLAVAHGYFGADETQSEGGESMQIADREEAWVFQILADDTGASAVWAAKRVPDGHVAVVANQFTIRRLELDDPANFRYSPNIHEVAERAGLWNRALHGFPLDFTATFALSRGMLSPYATRRQWRVFTRVAPSLAGTLPPDTTLFADDYPFSVAAERQLSVADITDILRDHYEGTPYDMTKGIAAGPYGDPSRFDPGSTESVYSNSEAVTESESNSGSFERAISIYRCAYSWVSQTRGSAKGLDLIWFGQYAPHASQYLPVYVGAEAVPQGFARGSLYAYDDAASYWVHASVGNWADRFYMHTIGEIKSLQAQQEEPLFEAQHQIETRAAELLSAGNRTGAAKVLAEHSAKASAQELASWGQFFHKIIAKYKDGQRLDNIHEQYTLKPTLLFYPRSWLKSVGFWKADTKVATLAAEGASHYNWNAIVSHVTVAFLAGLVGVTVGRRTGVTSSSSNDGNRGLKASLLSA